MQSFDEPHTTWQFTPTKWHSVADKEKFARHYIQFVQARCPFQKFHEWFYERLTHMFFHIAHYNRFGFYETWCDTPEKRLGLLRHHLAYECVGDPKWAWSDVERTLQGWLAESGILREYEFEANAARRQTNLTIARTALSELTDDDVASVLQERYTVPLETPQRDETARVQVSPHGEQQSLFQL